jgi:hypothetical protein
MTLEEQREALRAVLGRCGNEEALRLVADVLRDLGFEDVEVTATIVSSRRVQVRSPNGSPDAAPQLTGPLAGADLTYPPPAHGVRLQEDRGRCVSRRTEQAGVGCLPFSPRARAEQPSPDAGLCGSLPCGRISAFRSPAGGGGGSLSG